MGAPKVIVLALSALPAFFFPVAAAQGLAAEDLDPTRYAANLTETRGGWIEPGLCEGLYCVYANRRLAGGRGVAMVTTSTNRIQLERTESWLNQPASGALQNPPFELQVGDDGRAYFVANTTIKRGTVLGGYTPVLMVHQRLFADVKDTTAQDRLLNAAVALLPEPSRTRFHAQGVERDTGRPTRDRLFARPLEIDMGYATGPSEDAGEKHYLNFPEVHGFSHACRPNAAHYIDARLAHRAVAARKIAPGERITLSYQPNLLQERADRQAWHRRLHGRACGCAHCTGGDLDALARSDARVREIRALEAELGDHTSTAVAVETIERLVALYKEEGLHARLAGPYTLAALNYNYLGRHAEAVRYAQLAAQAGVIEQGPESVDALTMRILAKEPKKHYSWNQKEKYRGPNVGKRPQVY